MTNLLTLLGTILPLALLAAVSPVIILTSATMVTSGHLRQARGYLMGQAAVLLPIGLASAGLLGVALRTQVSRDIASRTVDGVLGLLLLGYAAWLIRAQLKVGQQPTPAPQHRHRAPDGDVIYGVLAMATNFTTLPLYLSAAQHIGAAAPALWLTIALLLLVTAVTLIPAWAPIALAKVAPGLLAKLSHAHDHHDGPPKRWTIGALVPIGACLLGGVVLLAHAASFVVHPL